MSQDTNVPNLIINKLTKQQYEGITTPDPTQLYMVTDEVISSEDVTDALGYTPQEELVAGDNITIAKEIGWSEATQDSDLGEKSGWLALCCDGAQFVALGEGGYVSTSTDGENWTTPVQNPDLIEYAGSDGYYYTSAYDGTKFVALGFYGYVATSTDGTNWVGTPQDVNLGPDKSWRSLVYDGTKFVALGASGYISTSTDGTTWTSAAFNSNLGNNSWRALAYDGTNFVALGASGYTSTSTDGTIWTSATFNSNLGNHSWSALSYDGTNFVALGDSGYISTSTNGTTWTSATLNSNLGDNSWQALAYDGTKFVALGYSGYISASTDGPVVISATSSGGTWGSITGTLSNQTDLQTALNGKQDSLVSGTNIKTINSTSLLGNGNISITGLPSQTSQSGKFLRTNGSTALWSDVPTEIPTQTGHSGKFLTTNGTTASWGTPSIAWGSITGTLSSQTDLQDVLDNKQVKLQAGNNIEIIGSIDLSVWTQATRISGGLIAAALACNGTKFVALGQSGYISTSTDGETWTQAAYVTNLGNHSWKALMYDGTKFVALGSGYTSTSTDGETWTSAAYSRYLSQAKSIAYDGTKYVAMSESGDVTTSTDGTTWLQPTYVSNLGNNAWNCLVYANNKFVALGQSGKISTSTDGETWTHYTTVSNLGNHGWRALVYDGTKFVALGYTGYISTSTDGETWTQATQVTISSSDTYIDLAYGGSQFVTLTSNDYIYTASTISSETISAIGLQPTLVSGTNIKTINSTSLLGSGDISVQPVISTSAMLSSDLVDDTDKTHKFATAAQLTQIGTNTTDISTINGKIPSAATSSNQLADKAFVNSSVQTATANFRGNWDTWSDVPTSASSYPADYAGSTTPTVNDYMVVQDASGYTGDTLTGTWRFKYSGTWSTDGKSGWLPEYQVNETPLTSAQLAALNSGITTTTKVTHTASTAVGSSTTPVYIASDGAATALSYTIEKSVPSNAVFTDTTYSDFTGATSIAGGAAGLVPAPSSGDNDKILTGGATWSGLKTVNSTSLLGSGDISVLQNTATGTHSLTIYADSTSAPEAVNIGFRSWGGTESVSVGTDVIIGNYSVGIGHAVNENLGSTVGSYSVAIGREAKTSGSHSIAVGDGASASGSYAVAVGKYATASSGNTTAIGYSAFATANRAIQIGGGTNSTADTLQIGFTNGSTNPQYQLLNGITGLIPDARISSNIARTSALNAKVNKEYSNVSLFGNPTLTTDHVLSGFSTKSYAQLPAAFQPGSNTWEMVFKVTLGTFTGSQVFLGQTAGVSHKVPQLGFSSDGYLQTYLSSDGTTSDIENGTTLGTTVFSAGDTVYVKMEFTGSAYNVYSSSNGTSWTSEITISSSTPIYSNSAYVSNIGYNYWSATSTEAFNGSIDLKECYIKIGGSYFWKGVGNATNLDTIANIRGKDSLNKVDKSDIWYNSTSKTLYIGVAQN